VTLPALRVCDMSSTGRRSERVSGDSRRWSRARRSRDGEGLTAHVWSATELGIATNAVIYDHAPGRIISGWSRGLTPTHVGREVLLPPGPVQQANGISGPRPRSASRDQAEDHWRAFPRLAPPRAQLQATQMKATTCRGSRCASSTTAPSTSYIQMPQAMRVTEAAGVLVQNAHGGCRAGETIRLQAARTYVVVDKLFGRRLLIYGRPGDHPGNASTIRVAPARKH